MNLVYGEIVEISSEEGMPIGKVRVRGATRKIPLGLLTDASRGDRVLICDGVAISKVAGDVRRRGFMDGRELDLHRSPSMAARVVNARVDGQSMEPGVEPVGISELR